jgi:D-alanyl-D-alanine carboxypeptidase/D-alanyl-D-alanine-endopeptidase (penicillin-binding protein 4)
MMPVKAANLLKFLLLSFFLLYVSFAHAQYMDKRTQRTLDVMIRESSVFSQFFTGFALYDPAKKAMLYQKDAFKYFTPASNTKIFTLYTTLKILGDSMPVLRYGESDGMLVVQGTGNPLFLHPDFQDNRQGWDILSGPKHFLLFSEDNFQDDHFGPGWSWGDYRYAYQVEKTSFPLYGNLVYFRQESPLQGLKVYPRYFSRLLNTDTKNGAKSPQIWREESGDRFFYNDAAANTSGFSRALPYNHSPATVRNLLADTLGLKVFAAEEWTDALPTFQTLYAPLPDTLLRRFMQESDNFLAEQLMLMCAAKLFDGRLNTDDVIQYAKTQLFGGFPDTINWADGSGLSRYNLFTPRTITTLLERLYQEVPHERLFSIFPAGGQSGTIRSWYGGKEKPYVFAKTGSLANQHCLSGYIRTKKDRVLIFSFMHNNFIGSGNPLRAEMQKVLEWIWATL